MGEACWWRRRTTLQKCVTVASILLGFLVIGLISVGISLLLRNEMSEGIKSIMEVTNASVLKPSSLPLVIWLMATPRDLNSTDVCSSEECLYAAWEVLDKINSTIEPCDNFYQFACGKFLERTQIPEDQATVNIFTELSDKVQHQIQNIIMNERPKTEPKYLRLPNDFYKACMNTTLIESLGSQPMQQISDSLGGWPVVVGNSWNSDNLWSWQETVKQFRQLGLSAETLFHMSVDVDWKNSTRHIIKLDQPLLGVGQEVLSGIKDESIIDPLYDYKFDYVVDIAVLFGAKKEAAKKELKDSLRFGMDIARITVPLQERRNSHDLYNLSSIKQLQASYPYIQWLDYINAYLPKGQNVDENQVVNVMVPSFFDQLGKLLARANKRAIANFMMTDFHIRAVTFLTKDFRERQFQYESALVGQRERPARWKECVDMVTNKIAGLPIIVHETSLPILVGAHYVREHFREDSKAVAVKTVNNIRVTLDQMLDDITWMDDITKQEAERKLRAITAHIGYPDEMLDNDKLEKYYRGLEIDPQKYFESYLNIQVFYKDKNWSRLRMPVVKADWTKLSNPFEINAYYSRIENNIQFPAGILQDPFFNRNLPNYMNYGAIGSSIGHEIAHCFDSRSRSIDANGQLNNWWQPSTEEEYVKKAQCIQEQYGNYTDKQTGLKINGLFTRDENIADNGGVELSYRAYEKWITENGEEQQLPGVDYTTRQMFWISFAQTWCSKYRKEALEAMIIYDLHLPSELRVLGPLHNMKEFSRDFKCPTNSPMNPAKKCKFW